MADQLRRNRHFAIVESDDPTLRSDAADQGASVGTLEAASSGGGDAPGDEIGDVNATNGQIGGLGVGFGHWQPPGGQSSKNVECLSRQREKGDRDPGHLRPQFVIGIKKHNIGNISRTERRLVRIN
jgi:hypothetical protein